MSVGELAERVGVTVRTIQYYDNQNLLKPSAKGSGNKRLYTKDDEEKLYKILCLKFMGLNINEIKENLEEYNQNDAVSKLIDEKLVDMEKSIMELVKHFTTLKNLKEVVKESNQLNWSHFANVVERFQDDGKYFWKLVGVFEENKYTEHPQKTEKQKSVVENWHNLIADTITLIQNNVTPDSEESRDIAKRYLEMENDITKIPPHSKHKDFVLFDSVKGNSPHGHKGDSFTELRYQVNDFIQNAVKLYNVNQNSSEENK